MVKPPLTLTLTWEGDLRFLARTSKTRITLDSKGDAGPSPMEALAHALAGCMAMDIADIVRKGRYPMRTFECDLTGVRQDDPPRYFVSFTLHFRITGEVPAHAVERAIQLSRDKYCSVWHSLRQDTRLETSFEVTP